MFCFQMHLFVFHIVQFFFKQLNNVFIRQSLLMKVVRVVRIVLVF
jgi:hypothetical protein